MKRGSCKAFDDLVLSMLEDEQANEGLILVLVIWAQRAFLQYFEIPRFGGQFFFSIWTRWPKLVWSPDSTFRGLGSLGGAFFEFNFIKMSVSPRRDSHFQKTSVSPRRNVNSQKGRQDNPNINHGHIRENETLAWARRPFSKNGAYRRGETITFNKGTQGRFQGGGATQGF